MNQVGEVGVWEWRSHLTVVAWGLDWIGGDRSGWRGCCGLVMEVVVLVVVFDLYSGLLSTTLKPNNNRER